MKKNRCVRVLQNSTFNVALYLDKLGLLLGIRGRAHLRFLQRMERMMRNAQGL